MSINQEILSERREKYEEQQRILLAQLMTEKGGLCMKGITTEEIERITLDFYKKSMILDMKFIDVVRDDWGLDPEDATATFGDDLETRWDYFLRKHIIRNEKGEETILYQDRDEKYRLIPGKYPKIKDLGFVIDKYDEIVFDEEEEKDVNLLPSITIMGIEGLCGEKYGEYNLEPSNPNFFITQVMILTGELLDVIKENKKELKESGNELFKILEEKYNEIF